MEGSPPKQNQLMYVIIYLSSDIWAGGAGGGGDGLELRLQMTLPDVEGPELLEMVLGPARKASNGASSSSKRQRVA